MPSLHRESTDSLILYGMIEIRMILSTNGGVQGVKLTVAWVSLVPLKTYSSG